MNNDQDSSRETAESQNSNPENTSNIFSDVLGSYTGITEDGEPPIQDADDL